MSIITPERHRQFDLALALVERKLRTTPVHVLTGVPESALRQLYRLLHGSSPRSGSIPSTGHLLSSRRRQTKISVFAKIYQSLLSKEETWVVEGRLLIQSHDLFKALIGFKQAEEIDLTAGWSIIRELQAGVSKLPQCHRCGAWYIISENADVPPSCPFCALRRRQGSRAIPPEWLQ
jgi:hypothetical protein